MNVKLSYEFASSSYINIYTNNDEKCAKLYEYCNKNDFLTYEGCSEELTNLFNNYINNINNQYNINLDNKKLFFIQNLTGLNYKELRNKNNYIINESLDEIIINIEERKIELDNYYIEIYNDILKLKNDIEKFNKINK